ncbi:response regulator, partial [Vibrio sp. 10N.222.52.C3]|uniref:response regulator n=1 Tax=Vibrio sp. 10N.222.52.C3 TaxID=3229631 RepID=UPI003552DAEB
LLNIVGNAIKFTEKGEINLLISCDNVNKNKTKLSFEIIDTGIGISGEDIDKLFKPFIQVDESTSRMYGGTGLGLIISKQLVELMGGRLTVKSDQGKGSQFSFEIILDIAPEILDNQENQADVPKLNLKPLKNKHILLVEDNFINQELVKALLKGVTRLDVCSDGEKAIHQLSQQKYDGILMDCQLPQIDGYQATQMIRQELGLSLPIIAMTANIMSADIDKAIESGMNDIIGKPIDTQDMYRKMLKWFTNQIVETNDAGEVVADKPVAPIPNWLSKVSTIDLEAGLKIAAGNTALYLKLLSAFIEQYRGTSIEANEHQKVHQLKGTAGNLGATTLYQACVSHEEKLEQESLIELNLKLNQLISDLMPLNDNQKSPSTQLSEEKMMETLIGHVLIVEDDLINQCLLKNQLKDLGLSSDVSNDGQHALTQLKERKGAYDLILTDIHMPNLDGHSLAREVKTNIGLYGYANIVGCTGESNYTLENFEYFDALISKPIDSKAIYDNISKFLVKSEPLSTSEPESEIESNFSDYSNENKRDIYSVIIQSMSLDIESLDKSDVDLRALAHKIKGTANMLGLTEIATLAQELQNGLDPQKIVSQKCMLTKKMNEIVEEVKDLLEGIE